MTECENIRISGTEMPVGTTASCKDRAAYEEMYEADPAGRGQDGAGAGSGTGLIAKHRERGGAH